MGKGLASAMAAVALVMAAPTLAQNYSNTYTFLKAVKDRDGDKVTDALSEPGSVVVNARERGSGDGGLHIVTRARDLTWLRFLLGKGARPDLQNQQGNSALTLAAQIGWAEGAQELLARKASVDLGNGRGETPLILAVQRRDMAMVRLLLSYGASPAKTDNVTGLSAIDYARQDARAAAILKMLEAPGAGKAKVISGPKL